jgi:predicted nucleotidyltransferase
MSHTCRHIPETAHPKRRARFGWACRRRGLRRPAYPETVAAQLSDVLAGASLSGAERRVVERLVERLREELGSDLHAIWLYGSRARGETPHPESDIDLMVLADGGDHRYGVKAMELAYEVAPTEGVSPAWCSLSVAAPEWLHGRREIRSFFIAEVDRDKRVLYGSGLE